MKDTEIKCRCASPVIIVNPKLKFYLFSINILHLSLHHEYYTQRDFDKLRKRLTRIKYKDKLDYDTISEYYSITFDGEIIPLYILVPCNKCFICKDKLSQMWQFRGIAESNSSKYKTYFITLTYNNTYLPYDGVSVTAIQLFMKRLRNNLDKLNITHKLKYFACGEYGSNTKRPHYHLILWHFPDSEFNNLSDVLDFICKSWSVYDYENDIHIPIGYCYVKPCNSGSLQYVMKYTRKLGIAPQGMKPFFTCCSKYIGIQWFYDNYKYLNDNPDILNLSIQDPTTNKIFTSPFPTYYKQKIMPDFCKIFPKEIMTSLDYCLHLHTEICTIKHILNQQYKTPEILNKYFNITYDNEYYNLSSCDIDDYLYHRYSCICPFSLDKEVIKKITQLQPYLILLENYYNSNIEIFLSSKLLKTQRETSIQAKEFTKLTLDMLRIQNEKLERWRKKEIVREFF